MKGVRSVAAALIVKNEERFLPGCFDSLSGRVDDIIIVDTGSSDATVNIATGAGAKVIHHQWTGDFAAARNVGLDAVGSEWFLYIDADERLRLPEGGRVSDYLDSSAIAAFVRFQPKKGYTRYREPRLFRNDPRLRFRGRLHETFMPVLREISARENLPIARTSIELDHLGYDGDQSEKHARNLPLLEDCVRCEPNRLYYWHHLAETLAALGRTDEALAAANEGFARAEFDVSEKAEANASLILQTIARLSLERGDDPLPLIEENAHHLAQDYGLAFLRGHALLNAGRPLEALQAAMALRRIDPDELHEGLLAFDRGIFRGKACELAAQACLDAGKRREAAAYLAEAELLAASENAAAEPR